MVKEPVKLVLEKNLEVQDVIKFSLTVFYF
jgi:hypothetical protein